MTKLLLGETRRPGDAQQARGGEVLRVPLRLPSRTCQPPRLQGPSSETAPEVKAHCGLFPCSLGEA